MACIQVEWAPYMTDSRALLNEHPHTTFIGGITCFDIVEVYLSERAMPQVGFVQAIPPCYATSQGSATGTWYLLRDVCFFGCVLGGME